MREPKPEEMERWVRQWQQAGKALEAQKRQELSALTDACALEMTETLLELSEGAYISPRRRKTSGLVEQQAIFQKLRKP